MYSQGIVLPQAGDTPKQPLISSQSEGARPPLVLPCADSAFSAPMASYFEETAFELPISFCRGTIAVVLKENSLG